MNHIPSYPVLPITKYVTIAPTAINTSLTFSENTFLLYTTPANSGGTLFSNIIIAAQGNTAACVVRFHLNNGMDNNVATNNVLMAEYAVPATTASATVGVHRQQQIMEVLLPPKYRIYVTITANSTSPLGITGSFLEY